MRKSTCIRFFERYIHEVSSGRGDQEHVDPFIDFNYIAVTSTELLKRKFEHTYLVLTLDVDALSNFWQGEFEVNAIDILRVALENIDIDKESLHKIAEILSECYQSSVEQFVPEILVKEAGEIKPYLGLEEYLSVEDDLSDTIKNIQINNPFSKNNSQKGKTDNAGLESPQKIYQWMENHIYGQKEAVKAATMLLYNHIQGRKRNILFVGPTGCGKTEIWRVCQRIYPNIRIVDGAMITGEGWSGSFKVTNIFDGMNKQEAEKAIIVIDEFDKLCEPQIGSSGTDHSHILQNNLLKLIEGTEISLGNCIIDTSKISFVFCGSFEYLTEMKTAKESEKSLGFGATLKKPEARLVYEDEIQPEDLVKYAGVRQEIAGRINQIVQLLPMTAEDYKAILDDEKISPLHQIECQYGIKLCLEKATEQKLVQEAEETHMGVRYLRSRIQQMLDDQMFQDCGRAEYILRIVTDNNNDNVKKKPMAMKWKPDMTEEERTKWLVEEMSENTLDEREEIMFQWEKNHKEELENLSETDQLKVSVVVYRSELTLEELDKMTIGELLAMHK